MDCTAPCFTRPSPKSWASPLAPSARWSDSSTARMKPADRITSRRSSWSIRMDKIGTYQIVEEMHRGPQPLYRAKAADGRVVALKATPVANLTPEMRERFLREAETCRTLDHANVIR